MFVEVRCNPVYSLPYGVYKKLASGWLHVKSFDDEFSANVLAKKISQLPDIPCYISKWEKGNRIDPVVDS